MEIEKYSAKACGFGWLMASITATPFIILLIFFLSIIGLLLIIIFSGIMAFMLFKFAVIPLDCRITWTDPIKEVK